MTLQIHNKIENELAVITDAQRRRVAGAIRDHSQNYASQLSVGVWL